MSGEFGLEPLLDEQLAFISDMRIGKRADHATIAENSFGLVVVKTLLRPIVNTKVHESVG